MHMFSDKVILFLTDGENAAGRNPLQVIKELNEPLNNSVIIHTFGLGSSECHSNFVPSKVTLLKLL